MSTIDRKYNLIRSREWRRWDGRYWKRTGMAINGTTPSQCSIMAIWFINYPWRWGFYLTRHANLQRRHTRAFAPTKKGNIWYHGEALLSSVWCDALWLRAGLFEWALRESMIDSLVQFKHTLTSPNIAGLMYTHDFFFFRWGGHSLVEWLNAACPLPPLWQVLTSLPWNSWREIKNKTSL